MHVVILHCHFERGGVTQVVENHVQSLKDQVDRIVLVSGPRTSGLSQQTRDRVENLIVEEMEYDAVRQSTVSSERLSEQIANELTEHGLSRDQALLHWHNHSLGKNVAQPAAIKKLADDGFRQLLQIHDFAEDYRPENVSALIRASNASEPIGFANYCYPTDSQIHYATLTRSDARVLESLGISSSCIQVLPNCVHLGGELPAADQSREKILVAAGLPADARWCLYPVRGIRRKNVGEFCLLSQFLPDEMYAGITLPPATEIERRSYERWRNIAQEIAPRAVFDAGTFAGVSFQENLAACDVVVSTSAAEGFGMAFLEPWLARRPVVARRLPAVVSDFEASGLRLDEFYDAISIPADAGWREEADAETAVAFQNAWKSIPEWFRPMWTPPTHALDRVDFGKLSTERQNQVLRRVHSDSGFKAAIGELNTDLIQSLTRTPRAEVIERNRQQILNEYSIEKASARLHGIYSALLETPESTPQRSDPGDSSVQLVCRERDFFPCRTESEIKE